MPKRGILLTDYEKGTIHALLEEKKPVKEIATRLGRSYKCLYNHINRNVCINCLCGLRGKLLEK